MNGKEDVAPNAGDEENVQKECNPAFLFPMRKPRNLPDEIRKMLDSSAVGILFASLFKQMLSDYGVSVTMSESLESLPAESFDAILCLDVWEHWPDPPQAVKDGSKLLKPGGFYISSSPYFVVGWQWPTHLKSNKKYAGAIAVLERAGEMKLVDGCFLHNPLVFQKRGRNPCSKKSCVKFFTLMYGAGWLWVFRFFPWLILPIVRNC